MGKRLLFWGTFSFLLSASLLVPSCSDSNSPGGGTSGAASGTPVGGGTGVGGSGIATSGAGSGAATSGSGNVTSGAGASGIAMSGVGASGIAMSGAGSGAATSGSGMPGMVDMNVAVLERNKHPSRDGNFTQPLLMKAKVATMAADAAFKATFNGAMWASPLYLDQGPGGKGIFIAVTTGNDIFALDETDGHTVWTKNIGNSPQNNGVPCGNIHPLGILSTPVIDPKPGADGFATIYVAGAIGTNSITAHEVHARSAKDGTERAGWPANASNAMAAAAQAAGFQYNVGASNQRSALSLVNGILYVAYGGHIGDCGGYHGYVVAIDTANPTNAHAWTTGGTGEAIWAAGGMASDGNGVIAITGNSTVGANTHADSEEVVRVTGMATVTRNNANIFYPSDWRDHLDANDLDFGSNSPVLISVPGATPATTSPRPPRPARSTYSTPRIWGAWMVTRHN
jgi:hypothetical protein